MGYGGEPNLCQISAALLYSIMDALAPVVVTYTASTLAVVMNMSFFLCFCSSMKTCH